MRLEYVLQGKKGKDLKALKSPGEKFWDARRKWYGEIRNLWVEFLIDNLCQHFQATFATSLKYCKTPW